ncbi:hypothetical protein MLD38_004745 [Melastoma candidum]|uniref:Uncharacterized protein n=1 Tax=Melastoma candidum TaxID=119954 RepID=A0ACB9S7H7_9MYRT|nr:hypothetical protein MLD38_004745 [Melastoma candidum]
MNPANPPNRGPLLLTLIFPLLLSVLAAAFLYQDASFAPAPLPMDAIAGPPVAAPVVLGEMRNSSEFVHLEGCLGPEDVAYDHGEKVIYTGCEDGWIRKVRVEDLVPEKWVNTGGRPLGLVFGLHGEVIVADTLLGLLSVTKDGQVEVLTDEAEGVKFKLTDAADVAADGTIYFTDATHKYSLRDSTLDLLEGRPNGRFLSYDPVTKETKVLVRDIYFANGVVVSPDQEFVVYCETVMNRCKKYYIKGEKEGTVENFIDHLPGMPDNIRYDGEGHYWIAIPVGRSAAWDLALGSPFLRRILGFLEKHSLRPKIESDSGVFVVDLKGNPVAHYYDPSFSMISSGTKIGNQVYCGSPTNPYIVCMNLTGILPGGSSSV